MAIIIKQSKCIGIVMLVIFSPMFFPACMDDDTSASGSMQETGYPAIETETTVSEETENVSGYGSNEHISDEFTSRGKTITVDADIEIPDTHSFYEVELTYSDRVANELIDTLFTPQYPDIEPVVGPDGFYYYNFYKPNLDGVSDLRGRQPHSLCGINIGRDNMFSYYDALHDINSSSPEEDHEWEWGYITDSNPPNMTITGEEAAVVAGEFLSQAIFTYEPINVVAYPNEEPGGSGYYIIQLMACLRGMPILSKIDSSSYYCSIAPRVYLSNWGVFSAQGAIVFDIANETELKNIIPFEDIYDNFKGRVSVYTDGKTVEVSRIYMAYVPLSMNDFDRLLKPAWCFDCIDHITEDGVERTNKITLVFSAENGDFWDVYF